MKNKNKNAKPEIISGFKLSHWARAVNDTLFPWNKCLVCGNRTLKADYICEKCLNQTQKLQRCVGCGCFLSFGRERNHTLLCPSCLYNKGKYVDEYFSALPYTGYTRELILELKYKKQKSRAVPIAEYTAECLLQKANKGEYDNKYAKILNAGFVTEVPLHSRRFTERGYNQSALLAEIIAHRINVPYLPNVLIRHKKTKIQNRLSPVERRLNVKNAFSAGRNAEKIKGKSVIVVDDILTSGNTVNSCAGVLKKIGAEEVFAVTATSVLVKL